jgi:NADPH:quinone reductase-like Zn-dependent oxidoreductase
MHAIVIEEFGPPHVLELREVADPECAAGAVLIEISFSSVTFVETQIRAGRAPHVSMLPQLPVIPGNGVAGTVVAAGPELAAEVLGARVVSTTGGTGGYAHMPNTPSSAGSCNLITRETAAAVAASTTAPSARRAPREDREDLGLEDVAQSDGLCVA